MALTPKTSYLTWEHLKSWGKPPGVVRGGVSKNKDPVGKKITRVRVLPRHPNQRGRHNQQPPAPTRTATRSFFPSKSFHIASTPTCPPALAFGVAVPFFKNGHLKIGFVTFRTTSNHVVVNCWRHNQSAVLARPHVISQQEYLRWLNPPVWARHRLDKIYHSIVAEVGGTPKFPSLS